MLQIIGFDGYAGSGKDTCADVLVSNGFKKVPFADPLRNACVIALSMTLDTFIDRAIKDTPFASPITLEEHHILDFLKAIKYYNSTYINKCMKFRGTVLRTPREALTFMGTEIARDTLCNEIWLNKYLENIQGLSYIVTPDARFDNEKEFLRSMGGRLVWVERDGIKAPSNHISETQKWKPEAYDVVVYNNSTIAEMTTSFGMWYTTINNRSMWNG